MNLNQCPAHRAQNYLSSLCVRRKKDNMSQEELKKTKNTETKETYQDIKNDAKKDFDVLSDLTSGNNYEKSNDRYKDNFSTAVTFLVCGIAGLVVVILNDTGILNFFSLKNASGILMSCVLGGMFIGFIVVGILSFKASRKDKKDAEIEKDNTIKVMEWLKDNAPAQLIEESYAGDGLSEEMKYFERSDFLKKSIKNEFPDFSDDYIQDVTDQYIDELFN